MIEFVASIAQLGERQTEDLKVPGSIPGRGTFCFLFLRGCLLLCGVVFFSCVSFVCRARFSSIDVVCLLEHALGGF